MQPPKIDAYQFGQIVVDGETYKKDVLIFSDAVQPNWWRERGHSLSMIDVEEVMRKRPEVLVLGQGAYGRMDVPEETRVQIESAGIQVITQPTKDACQTYNQLREIKHVIAALHLTC
jgi:hypothetical protein